MATIALISAICSPSGHRPSFVQSAWVCRPGPRLKTDFWVDDLSWSDQTQVALEGGIASVVPVLMAQLGVKVGAADVRTDNQTALDVDQLRFASAVGLARSG
jgi:hypothetical protein